MTQPSPGFERLAAIHEWSDTHPGPPLFPTTAPRPIPPVHHDTASVRRRTRVLRALARIRQDGVT